MHAGRRADFFCGVYQLETRFARIRYIRTQGITGGVRMWSKLNNHGPGRVLRCRIVSCVRDTMILVGIITGELCLAVLVCVRMLAVPETVSSNYMGRAGSPSSLPRVRLFASCLYRGKAHSRARNTEEIHQYDDHIQSKTRSRTKQNGHGHINCGRHQG